MIDKNKNISTNFFLQAWHLLRDKILIQILLAICICLLTYHIIPIEAISYLYAISLTLKSMLIFVLPFLIFGAIASSFAKIPRGGFLFTIGVLLGLTLSNFINMSVAYFVGKAVIQDSGISEMVVSSAQKIYPAFDFNLMNFIPSFIKKVFNNGFALIFGLLTGVMCSFFSLPKVESFANKVNTAAMFFVSSIFTRILPIFIAGSLLKMLREGEIKQMFESQLFATLSVVILIFGYLAVWFVIASGFKFSRLKEIFLNTLPAMLTGFSTMSSAAALPLSIEANKKNTHDPLLVRSLTPIITNFHMMGSSMAVSIAALIIMTCFKVPLPSYSHFALFGMYFCLNKFAGSGVPADSIIVTLPFFKSILGFDDDMLSLILAFYIVFDSVITLGNVGGNNLFVIMAQKVIKLFKKNKNAVEIN